MEIDEMTHDQSTFCRLLLLRLVPAATSLIWFDPRAKSEVSSSWHVYAIMSVAHGVASWQRRYKILPSRDLRWRRLMKYGDQIAPAGWYARSLSLVYTVHRSASVRHSPWEPATYNRSDCCPHTVLYTPTGQLTIVDRNGWRDSMWHNQPVSSNSTRVAIVCGRLHTSCQIQSLQLLLITITIIIIVVAVIIYYTIHHKVATYTKTYDT